MANISGVRKSTFDHRFSGPLVALAVLFLLFSAMVFGVAAVVVMVNKPAESSLDSNVVLTSITRISSTTHVRSTTTTTKRSTTLQPSTTLLNDGSPPTTFIEYITEPTTLPPAVLVNDSDCNDTGYHGPFKSCGAKNVAWFDMWG